MSLYSNAVMRYRIEEITEFLNSHDTCWEMLKISLKHKKVFTKKYVAFTCFSINAIGTKTEQIFIYNFFPILAIMYSLNTNIYLHCFSEIFSYFHSIQ